MNRSVPAAVEQLRDNMMSSSNNNGSRFNYYQSMLNIKEYAERACFEYERKQKMRR